MREVGECMPVPKKNESKSDFVARYVGSSEAKKTFPSAKQRVAVANSVYKEKHK
jgi:hypothetical protein